MAKGELITGKGGWGVYFSLLSFCGLALIFSMPWATYVKELLSFPWKPSPIVFFATYTLLVTIVGLNRGAARAPASNKGKGRIRTAIGEILFAHLLLFPYLAYVRVLLPGRESAIPLILGYLVGLSVSFGLFAYALESHRERGRLDPFTVRYGAAVLAFGLPLFARLGGGWFIDLTYLSPFAAVRSLLTAPLRPQIAIAFSLPLLLGGVSFAMMRRRER